MVNHVGENLKAYRIAKGLTQIEFAALCGISRQTINKHEAGRKTPLPQVLEVYAKVLGVSAVDLKCKLHPSLWEFEVLDSLIWS
jgi:transcriptional regulator with XRE-family HTH domain